MAKLHVKILIAAGLIFIFACLYLLYSFFIVFTGEEVIGQQYIWDKSKFLNLDGLGVSQKTKDIFTPNRHIDENILICDQFPKNVVHTVAWQLFCGNHSGDVGPCKFSRSCRNPRYVEFTTKNNIHIKELTFHYVWGLKDRNVRVFYNSNNPKNYRVLDFAGMFSLPSILLLFSIAGVIFGFLVKVTEDGYFFVNRSRENPNLYLVALAVKISLIDGKLETREVQEIGTLIRKFSRPEDKIEAFKIIRSAKSDDLGFDDLAKLYKSSVKNREAEQRLAFEFLVSVVSGFGELDKLEKEALKSIALIFEQPIHLLEEILAAQRNYKNFNKTKNFQEEPNFDKRSWDTHFTKWAYHELECELGADQKTIQKNYRKLVMKYHPDKLQQRGVTGPLLRQGNEKFLRIQKAYELLNK